MNKFKEIIFFLLIGILLTGWLWVIFYLSFPWLPDSIIPNLPVNTQILIILLYHSVFLFIGIFVLKRIFKKSDIRNSSFSLKSTVSTMFIHTCVFAFMYYLYTNHDWSIGIIGVYVGLSVFISIIIEIIWIIIDK